jgi:galactose mutarotase-like enzyme
MITIKNHQSWVKITTRGAQLMEWHDTFISRRILWQLNEDFWNRVSPLLFPIVGRLKNDGYRFNGSDFEMKQHGFARDCDFEVMESTENSILLRLVSNLETRKSFPFDFIFDVKYILKEQALEVYNTVQNTGGQNMYCSFGAHPGFHIEGSITDYQICIPGASRMQRHLIKEGLYTGESEWLEFQSDGVLQLTEDFFKEDAIVFKNENIQSIQIWQKNKPFLELAIKGEPAPYWGIWRKPGAPFLCLEPWWGIADSVNSNGHFMTKEGINSLLPNEKRSFDYKINLL